MHEAGLTAERPADLADVDARARGVHRDERTDRIEPDAPARAEEAGGRVDRQPAQVEAVDEIYARALRVDDDASGTAGEGECSGRDRRHLATRRPGEEEDLADAGRGVGHVREAPVGRDRDVLRVRRQRGGRQVRQRAAGTDRELRQLRAGGRELAVDLRDVEVPGARGGRRADRTGGASGDRGACREQPATYRRRPSHRAPVQDAPPRSYGCAVAAAALPFLFNPSRWPEMRPPTVRCGTLRACPDVSGLR